VVQLDRDAAPTQHPGGGHGVDRQGERAPRVVGIRGAPAGLVVDDDQFVPPRVQPVDAAGDGQRLGAGRHHPLDTDRLLARVEPADVPRHHPRRPLQRRRRLSAVAEAVAAPAGPQQGDRAGRRTPRDRFAPPGRQRGVHAGAQAVVGPRRSLRRRRPVQVGHPVPARTVQPGRQPGRCAGVEPAGHPGQLALGHGLGHGRAAAAQKEDSIAAVAPGLSAIGECAAWGSTSYAAPSRTAISFCEAGVHAVSAAP
jgi:hypothetical protein